jgi:hypothetical protein
MNSVFTLGLSYHPNRLLELVTFRVVLGVLFSVSGDGANRRQA